MAMVRLFLLSALLRFIQIEAVHLFVGKATCPKTLCIDFGSSGAKFSKCGEKTWEPKFLEGAGAFGRITEMQPLDVKDALGAYLLKTSGMTEECKASTKLKICGGTAGNRFKSLKEEDRPGWDNFNNALSYFVQEANRPRCQTLPGTTEAAVEFEVANKKLKELFSSDIAYGGARVESRGFRNAQQKLVFVGIGGASMQLRLNRGGPCPDLGEIWEQHWATGKMKLVRRSMFDGGVGASKTADFCKEHDGGQLWSFLADGEREQDGLHVVGGADQIALVFYPYLHKTLLRMEEYSDMISDIQWVDTVITETIWRDPMWRAMLTAQHEDQCMPLVEGMPHPEKYIVLLSGARRGAGEVAKQWTYRTDRNHYDANLLQTSAMSNETLDMETAMYDGFVHLLNTARADPGFWAVSAAARAQCTKAREDYMTTMEKDYWTKFKMGGGVAKGFLCESMLFHIGWMLTLAGYIPYQDLNEDCGSSPECEQTKERIKCVKDNFKALLNAWTEDGDWMTGALEMNKQTDFHASLPQE